MLAELLATADVVAENFTPRVMENSGFSYERVRELNDGIVMVACRHSGWRVRGATTLDLRTTSSRRPAWRRTAPKAARSSNRQGSSTLSTANTLSSRRWRHCVIVPGAGADSSSS